MICKSYNELTVKEKYQMIGKLVHLVMNDETAFAVADEMVKHAEEAGDFNDVTFFPSTGNTEDNDNE